jgi:hypothetical protein
MAITRHNLDEKEEREERLREDVSSRRKRDIKQQRDAARRGQAEFEEK